jgi:hypothetical protein
MPNRSSLGIPKSSNEIKETEVKFFSPSSLFLKNLLDYKYKKKKKICFFGSNLPVKFFGWCL